MKRHYDYDFRREDEAKKSYEYKITDSRIFHRTKIRVDIEGLLKWWRETEKDEPDQVITPENHYITKFLESGRVGVWNLQIAKPDPNDPDQNPISKRQPVDNYTEPTGRYFGTAARILDAFPESRACHVLGVGPQTFYKWHRDTPSRWGGWYRMHVALETNPGAYFVINDYHCHIPVDGRVWAINTEHWHYAYNDSETQMRSHFSWLMPPETYSKYCDHEDVFIQ